MSILSQLLPKKETKEFFLVLTIGDSHIHAAVASITGNQVTVLGHGESPIGKDGNDVEAADTAITAAEKSLPDQIVPEKTVFALPQFYLENDNVKPEYLARLKAIAKELSLVPHGFIEYPAAISFYLEREEGSPPTLLLLGIDAKHLTCTLIRVGSVQQHVQIPKTGDVSADFGSILPQLSAEILPSRILLYDEGENRETVRHELLKFPWHKHSTFLHTPKIEALPHAKLLTALIEAAASSFLRKMPQEDKKELEETKEDAIPPVETPPAVHEHKHTGARAKQDEAATFGFTKESRSDAPEDDGETEEIEEEEESEESGQRSSGKGIAFPKIPFSFPSFSVNNGFLRLAPLVIFLLLLLGGLGSLYWYYPKATVSLLVYPLKMSEPVDISFVSLSSSASGGSNSIQVKEYSQDLKGEKTTPATGRGRVGEKAKGETTLYNKTTSTKTFPKGTVISNGDLQFTLDDDVAVASASDTGEGLTFGKGTVNVTALSIGPSGNLPEGSTFTLKDFPESSYTAKNTTAFSGGTSKDVTSVSKEDQLGLEKALEQELVAQTKQTVLHALSPGETLIPESLTTEIVEKKFNAAVGTEAQDVTLSLTLRIQAFSYNSADIQSILQTTSSQVPAGYTRSDGSAGIDIHSISPPKNGVMEAKATATVSFFPDLNMDQIRENLRSKTYDEADAYLRTLPAIGGFKISGDTTLPLIGRRLPANINNVILNTATR